MTRTVSLGAPTRTGAVRLLRITSALAVATLLWQFVTAGALFGADPPVLLHDGGAIVLHLTTAAVVVAALRHRQATRGPWWPTVLAAVVCGLTFVQAWFGGRTTLAIHVPGAMILTVGTVWLAAWAFGRPQRS